MNTAAFSTTPVDQTRSSVHAEAMPPLLSIGLPVYNGAAHLREAIDSLLAQDIEDFELVISDNASTDDTQTICLEYASRDPRVRYSRLEANAGAASNFNRVFELSRGRYFMWGSDDDLWDPRFARACIERLERAPGAVLCTSRVTFIDSDGAEVPDFEYESVDTEGLSPEDGIRRFTSQFGWFGTYSVIRPSSLRATRMHLPTFAMDVRLQLELLLQGDCLVVPEKLRSYRLPDAGKTATEYVSEIDPDRAGAPENDEIRTPWTYLAREVLRTVRDSRLDDEAIRRVESDLVETLASVNLKWGELVLRESGVAAGTRPPAPARREIIRAALHLDGCPADHAPLASPWQSHPGMRLAAIRRLALRVLQPFGDRQNELNARHAEAIGLMESEIERLRRRVQELERERSRRGGSDAS